MLVILAILNHILDYYNFSYSIIRTKRLGWIHVKKELAFCIGSTSKKPINRHKIEPNSPRHLILGSFLLPQTSLSVLDGNRVLPKIGQNMAQNIFRKA